LAWTGRGDGERVLGDSRLRSAGMSAPQPVALLEALRAGGWQVRTTGCCPSRSWPRSARRGASGRTMSLLLPACTWPPIRLPPGPAGQDGSGAGPDSFAVRGHTLGSCPGGHGGRGLWHGRWWPYANPRTVFAALLMFFALFTTPGQPRHLERDQRHCGRAGVGTRIGVPDRLLVIVALLTTPLARIGPASRRYLAHWSRYFLCGR
jgi:hypothetical protein